MDDAKAVTWEGVERRELVADWYTKARDDIADAGRDYQWDRLLTLIREHGDLVNSTRLDGPSQFAPLHQAAHGGAPVAVVGQLVAAGAWRTLQNARGERPVDVATRQGHLDLLPALEPVLQRNVPVGILLAIQRHFHTVISGRAREGQLDLSGLRLPELEPLLELSGGNVWFSVPGMYGGFSYWLEQDGVEAKLVTESWCRVVGGSGQRHEITSAGATLVAEGFV